MFTVKVNVIVFIFDFQTLFTITLGLNNDARDLMKQIEEKLFKFHEIDKQKEKEENPEK